MFVHLTCAAALAVKLLTAEEGTARNLVGDSAQTPEIELAIDSQLAKDQYNVLLGDLSIKGTDKALLDEILAISSAMKEIPRDMAQIIHELTLKRDDIISDLKSGAYNFATVFTNDPESIKQLKGIEKANHIRFFFSTSKELADSFQVPFPGVLAYNATDKNLLRLPFRSSFDSLVAAITLPSLSPINQENFKYYQALDQKLFYIINNIGTYEADKKRFGEVAKQCSSFAKFIFFTPEDVPALIPLLKVSDSDYPIMISLATEGKGLVRSVTPESFAPGVQSLITQTAEKILFASVIPEDNESRPVKVLNTHSLPATAEATEKDVLIAFTSPSCKFCQALEPELESVAKILSEKEVPVVIGNYNIMENEELEKFKVSGVPTLFFIKKGTNTPVVVPSDIRSASKLLKYLAEESVASKINLEDYADFMKEEKATKEESEPFDDGKDASEEDIPHGREAL